MAAGTGEAAGRVAGMGQGARAVEGSAGLEASAGELSLMAVGESQQAPATWCSWERSCMHSVDEWQGEAAGLVKKLWSTTAVTSCTLRCMTASNASAPSTARYPTRSPHHNMLHRYRPTAASTRLTYT